MIALAETCPAEPAPSSDAPAKAWFVLMVGPQSERTVQARAKEFGIEVYFPVSRRFDTALRERKGVSKIIERPSMPGYVFVDMPLVDAPFALFDPDAERSITGAIRFLANGGAPEALAPAIIDDLKQREADGDFDETARTENGRYKIPKWLKEKTVVRIVEGPFRGFTGRIDHVVNEKTVALWVQLFGRISLMSLPLAFLRKSR
jgi:transcription antitermination factor NusG